MDRVLCATIKGVKKQLITLSVLGAALLCVATYAFADAGFYGGVSLRDGNVDPTGLKLSTLPLSWARFATPVPDEPQRALFGGYRWRSDVAVEAAFNAPDQYALQPRLVGPAGGVGLKRVDPGLHTWNADVYTSWEFIRSLSLYGRMGYAQSDPRPSLATNSLLPGDLRRPRDGVNYGVGVRYDMTQSLGLRVEYSRFGRFSGESTGSGLLPDSDQLMIGVQFRF